MKNIVVAILSLMGSYAAVAASETLDACFRDPPQEARTFSWWHWQDGFLNADQMERELAFMKRAGLGGCQQFVAGWTNIPTNGEHLVTFMTDEWLGFSRRAIHAAATNGLEYGLQNGAGWTGVGGPWMTPEKSMKHVFAVERRTRDGKAVTLPPLGDGQYQPGPSVNDRTRQPWYGDIRSFAFPTPPACAEADLPKPRVSSVPASKELARIFDRLVFSCHGAHAHPPAFSSARDAKGADAMSVRFDWDAPVTVRSLRMKGVEGAESAEVWASVDGKDFHLVTRLSEGYWSFEDVYNARWHALPKTTCRAIELRWLPSCGVKLYEAAFSSRPALTGFNDQCGRESWNPLVARTIPEESGANLNPTDVLDITDRVAADGTLSFTPPDGREWTVLRVAATSTRRTNQPTLSDMSGPACDIMDPEAIRFHLSQYFGKMLEIEKDLRVHTIGNVLLDSWEQGTATWTQNFPAEFRARRGYDIAKYLPVFGGYFVGSRETAERFLWDFRKTINEVVRDNFFKVMADYCHARGIKHYVEGFACGVGTFVCDPLMAYLACDVPMTEASPSVREASSAAHLLGGKLVAVEAHTSAADWTRTPRDYKPREDSHFRHGITRIVYHGGGHNPKAEWRYPGLTFGGYGTEIPPGQTWAKYMRNWQDYLARCQFMLRRGAFVADVLAFAGEDYRGQIVGVYDEDSAYTAGAFHRDRLLGLPRGFDYDLVNADFLKKLSVFADGTIGYAGNPDATHYRVLVLREADSAVSVEVARELKRLVSAGATVIGPRLVKSLGRPNDGAAADAEVAAIGEELVKSGRYRTTRGALAATVRELGLRPDFVAEGATVGNEINYLHRREGDAEIYYVLRMDRIGADARMGFRVTGRVPEIFDPLTGRIAEATDYEMKDGYTYLPAMTCDAKEATRFVVFRKRTDKMRAVPPVREVSTEAFEPEWTIRFQDELGVDKTITAKKLFDWSTHSDPEIATFSGTAVYKATLNPQRSTAKLRLGRVEEIAEVFVDGTSCGVVWCEPYEVDISEAVKGKSSVELEIRLVSSWHNRLLADQKRPETERKTTYTGRPPRADAKPVPCGLLGPVLLESSISAVR